MEEHNQQTERIKRKPRFYSGQIKIHKDNWYIMTTFFGLAAFLVVRAVQLIVEVLNGINLN